MPLLELAYLRVLIFYSLQQSAYIRTGKDWPPRYETSTLILCFSSTTARLVGEYRFLHSHKISQDKWDNVEVA